MFISASPHSHFTTERNSGIGQLRDLSMGTLGSLWPIWELDPKNTDLLVLCPNHKTVCNEVLYFIDFPRSLPNSDVLSHWADVLIYIHTDTVNSVLMISVLMVTKISVLRRVSILIALYYVVICSRSLKNGNPLVVVVVVVLGFILSVFF